MTPVSAISSPWPDAFGDWDPYAAAQFVQTEVRHCPPFFFHLLFTLSPCRTYTPPQTCNPISRGSDAYRGARTLDQNTREIHKEGFPVIGGEQIVRATAKDDTRQNTKDTRPVPGQKLKFMSLPGIERVMCVHIQTHTFFFQ